MPRDVDAAQADQHQVPALLDDAAMTPEAFLANALAYLAQPRVLLALGIAVGWFLLGVCGPPRWFTGRR